MEEHTTVDSLQLLQFWHSVPPCVFSGHSFRIIILVLKSWNMHQAYIQRLQYNCSSNIIDLARGTPSWLDLCMVCNRSWHLPGNPTLAWPPARLIKEWGCVDLCMDTMHLKDPFVIFGFEGSALSLPPFLLSHALPLFFNICRGPLYKKWCI